LDESKHANIFGHGAIRCRIEVAMKNKSLTRRMSISILIGAIILVVATYFSIGQRNILPSPGEPEYTQTPETNRIFTATSLPTSTITATNVPTSTITSTWTPLPTIQSDDVDMFVESLHLQCTLPCWGDMIPRETSELEAKHFLSSFGELDSSSTFFNYRGRPVVIDLTFGDGLLTSINLPPELTEYYRIHYLLAKFGLPEDVQLEIFPQTAEGTSWFNLVLLYPRDGFFAIFAAEGKPVNSIINICPEDVSPDLYLVESRTYSLEQMNGFISLILGQVPKSLESLTDIDKSQFYEIFRKQNNQCIATKVQTP